MRLVSIFRLVLFLLFSVLQASLTAADKDHAEVNVVVDLTEAGQKLTPASPDHHVYYFPLVGGYRERGEVYAGQMRPEKEKLLQALLKALDAQGYKRVADREHPPSLLLIFHWGHVSPDGNETVEGAENIDIFDKTEMRALVGGKRSTDFLLPDEEIDIENAATDSRFYLMVLAFDFEAAKKHEHKLLWSAKLSVPSLGISADDAMGALVRAGGSYFGRQTTRAQHVVVPVGHIGRVEAGPGEVKEMYESPPDRDKNKKP
jgi:hypothetical protein